MTWNLIKTAKSGALVADEPAEAYALDKANNVSGGHWHSGIERRPMRMLLFSLIVILIGSLIEFVPMFLVESNVKTIESVRPYTPLEVEGRDIYIREGCNACHSQLVRPFRSETLRYGDYSKSGEFVYDHPFLWGSKRTGPDLARGGDKTSKSYKTADWHFNHFYDPRSTSPGSIMPAYPWLFERALDRSETSAKISALRSVGVDFPEDYEENADALMNVQAKEIADFIRDKGYDIDNEELKLEDTELVALIAYLQKLGSDIHPKETALNK